MVEQSGVSDRFPKASPWPVFVALGFVVLEIGLVVGFFPVAVGGVLLFGGSVAGILTEAGYAGHLWGTLIRVGAVFLFLGAALITLQGTLEVGALLAATDAPNAVGNRLASRGVAVAFAGLVLIALGAVRPPAQSTP